MCGLANQCKVEDTATRKTMRQEKIMLPPSARRNLNNKKYVKAIKKEKKSTTPVSPEALCRAAITTSDSHSCATHGRGGAMKEKISYFGIVKL